MHQNQTSQAEDHNHRAPHGVGLRVRTNLKAGATCEPPRCQGCISKERDMECRLLAGKNV